MTYLPKETKVSMDWMDWMNETTVLRRAKNGDTYHRADCPRAGKTLPWRWAEGKTYEQVQESWANGLKPCKVCKPEGGL